MDGSLSQNILKVRIYATLGESLLPGGTVVNEGIVSKLVVECVVVFNFDKVVGGELFES